VLLLQHSIQLLGLDNSARESIENESIDWRMGGGGLGGYQLVGPSLFQ
jgi:hypothetical protein